MLHEAHTVVQLAEITSPIRLQLGADSTALHISVTHHPIEAGMARGRAGMMPMGVVSRSTPCSTGQAQRMGGFGTGTGQEVVNLISLLPVRKTTSIIDIMTQTGREQKGSNVQLQCAVHKTGCQIWTSEGGCDQGDSGYKARTLNIISC